MTCKPATTFGMSKMTTIETRTAERVASAVRSGDAEAVQRLLRQHPECVLFLDLPEAVTGRNVYCWADYAERYGQHKLLPILRSEFRDPTPEAIHDAIRLGDIQKLRQLFAAHPRYVRDEQGGINSWLENAAYYAEIEIAELLVSMGADVNARLSYRGTMLKSSIRSGRPEMVEWLLSRGAVVNGSDPDGDRFLIYAISREPEEVALRLVQLLVEHGAEVNRQYTVFGDKQTTFTALAWAAGKPKVAEYLRSKGAVERETKVPQKRAPKSISEEVVAYFEEHFGPPEPHAQIEIIPTEPAIAVHLIPPTENRKFVTLFTTGMSETPMKVPGGTDDFRFAELFIQLPANWPIDKESLSRPEHGWPITWLRSIATYPHERNSWLGGPVTIIANGEPPEPIGPGLKFTSLLVMVDQNFTSRDGRKIYLYRLMPLYTEERQLEMEKGIAALMRALDKNDIPVVVDLQRPNVTAREP
jgi:ankyrin repeat protein